MKSYPITDFSPGEIPRENPDEVNYFSSTADFLKACEKIGKLWPDEIKQRYNLYCKSAKSWFGGKDYGEAIDFLRNGDKAGAKKIAEAVKEAEETLIKKKLTWAPAVVGVIPCVPRFLAGIPSAMLKPLKTETRRKALAIICQLNGGSDRSQRTITARAGRICALAKALAQNYDISLYGYANYGKYPVMLKASSPIDYSEIAAIFAPSTLRHLLASFAHIERTDGGTAVTLDFFASDLPFSRIEKADLRLPPNFSDFVTVDYRELLTPENLAEKLKEIKNTI